MPANRKKGKKPAANPARGFATTSSAAKPRAPAEDDAPGAESETIDPASQPAKPAAPNEPPASAQEPAAPARAPADVTPEQLEAQLEDAELELFVDKYGARAKQDAQRHVARLQTERRLQRAQAERLHLDAWIGEELHEQMLGMVDAERAPPRGSDAAADAPDAVTDVVVHRAWTLRRALQGLGFPDDRTDEAICRNFGELVSRGEPESRASRESLWGLESCLDWLVVTYGRGGLPNYDSQKSMREEKSPANALDGSFIALGMVLRPRNPQFVCCESSTLTATRWLKCGDFSLGCSYPGHSGIQCADPASKRGSAKGNARSVY